MTLRSPTLAGDTLTGISGTSKHGVRVAVPMSEVTLLEARKFSAGRTVALGVALIPVAYLIAVAISLASLEP